MNVSIEAVQLPFWDEKSGGQRECELPESTTVGVRIDHDAGSLSAAAEDSETWTINGR
jgi:hypothetical protein